MKKFILSSIISVIALLSFAQNNVGIGTASPNASAALDITSTSKGLLIPRMTTAQRTVIASPTIGLLVYDTDARSLYQFNGTSWAAISGSALSLPFAGTDASGTSFQVTNNAAGGTAIAGKGNGSNSNAIGVYGESASATGVKGYSNNAGSVAVFGSSLAGTGVKAYSFTGSALDVIGNVKISGGNTNPADGAVLTSDASGNAVWKNHKIAFSVNTYIMVLDGLPAKSTRVVHLSTEEFDYGNNYALNTTNSSSFGNSVFVAPKTGLYHFNAAAGVIADNSSDEIIFVYLTIKILRVINGSSSIIYGATSEFSSGMRSVNYMGQANISKDIKLITGDIVQLEVVNNSNFNYSLNGYSYTKPHFGCHLIFED